jgi:transposase
MPVNDNHMSSKRSRSRSYCPLEAEKTLLRVGVAKSTEFYQLYKIRWGRFKTGLSGGRPPKLAYEDRESLKKGLEEKHHWTIKELRKPED